ncbi:MAG: lysine--tRNA ligase [Armatimonadetes bacterium]|nr:lysine--tRNA ligase [Armatimonadota bacterium]
MQQAPEEHTHRVEKLRRLQAEGRDPFAIHKYTRTHRAFEIATGYTGLAGSLVSVAGRLTAMRRHGKSTFADLHDETGRIQLLARYDVLGESRYAEFLDLDVGDIIGAKGKVFKTRTGEISVEIEEFTLLTKTLRPLPEKYHGLRDVELRSRRRYLDLMVNPDTRETFRARSRMIRALRSVLDQRGFIEVETPVMQPVYGGAAARPFTTHHNALDTDLYLRIALELYHKRLIVGGFERVYEIGKVFRNEGIDARHNPEFTMLEAYQAYADFTDMMRLIEDIVVAMAQAAVGSRKITYRGHEIDLSPPWKQVSYFAAIESATGVDFSEAETDEDALKMATSLELGEPEPTTAAEVFSRAFERYVQPQLIQPTFVVGYPVAVSPLAKRSVEDPRVAARFEPFIGGEEVGNAFSELNDPIDQRERFMQQAALRARGDEEAHPMDEDFLLALEHGMPPTGGIGLGIDRLAMIILDKRNLREVILFPLLRPEEDDG